MDIILNIDYDELKQKDIFKTKAYQSLNHLIQLILNNNQKEIE